MTISAPPAPRALSTNTMVRMAASSSREIRARASIMPRTLGQNVRLRKPSAGRPHDLSLGYNTIGHQPHQDQRRERHLALATFVAPRGPVREAEHHRGLSLIEFELLHQLLIFPRGSCIGSNDTLAPANAVRLLPRHG